MSKLPAHALNISLLTILLAACGAPNTANTAASPVQAMTRSQEALTGAYGDAYNRRADDGTVVVKVLAPAPAVWEALTATMTARKVRLTVLDRAAGRMGDTALVLTRRWNEQPMSYYMNCGSSMTGPRADSDRLKAVLLAQMSRMRDDTIGVAVHFSALATSNSGSAATPAECVSNGRGEIELLDEVLRRLGMAKIR